MTQKSQPHFVVFDLETQLSAQQVGGWDKAHRMKMSVGVVWDSITEKMEAYFEEDVDALVEHLYKADLVVGFNLIRFDYNVLSGYAPFASHRDLATLKTFDLLLEAQNILGHRLKLDSLAQATLNAPKSADGLQAIEWFKQGELSKIVEYCEQDVAITRDLFLFAKEKSHLSYTNRYGSGLSQFRIYVNLEKHMKTRPSHYPPNPSVRGAAEETHGSGQRPADVSGLPEKTKDGTFVGGGRFSE